LCKVMHKHHCVGGYYSKEDSLILTACIDGKKIETIEVSLSKLQVIQSRGVCNKNTVYHNQIVQLVEKNIPLIEQRLAA
ncbi:PcfJ domain-containing protein, partial [Dysgonomonas mossii]